VAADGEHGLADRLAGVEIIAEAGVEIIAEIDGVEVRETRPSMVKWRLAARPSGRPAQARRTASISESSHSTQSWSQLPTSNSIRKPFPDSTCRTKIASSAPPTTRKIKMRIAGFSLTGFLARR
jgi:hypothetical protein